MHFSPANKGTWESFVYRILEVNGKLVVGAGRSDLARLLAVAPDAAQIVVLRKNESLAALRTLRSDNLRLTHRISYLEEQVRDLLAPRIELAAEVTDSLSTTQDHIQVGDAYNFPNCFLFLTSS